MFERLGRAQQLHRPIDGASAFPDKVPASERARGWKDPCVLIVLKPLAKDAVRVRVARIVFSNLFEIIFGAAGLYKNI